jgi:hypothetical protein
MQRSKINSALRAKRPRWNGVDQRANEFPLQHVELDSPSARRMIFGTYPNAATAETVRTTATSSVAAMS